MTEDLDNRLKEQNAGEPKFITTYIPWKMIYTKTAENFHDARKREIYLKSTVGKKFIFKYLNGRSLGSLYAYHSQAGIPVCATSYNLSF